METSLWLAIALPLLLVPAPAAQASRAAPAGELVWDGTHRFRGEDLEARLYRVESRPGAPFIIETLPDPQFLALTGPEGEVSPDRQPRIAR